jgi:hypothetical protein
MKAAFIADERSCNYNEHHNKDNSLFVLREFKHSEQAFHVIAVHNLLLV